MWRDLLSLFKGGGLCEEAFEEAVLMLNESRGMFLDAISALHEQGAMVADIYERDRQLNRYERSVRRKIVTHLSVSTKTTAVAWYYEGAEGGFKYWPEGPDRSPARWPCRSGYE